MSRRVRRLRSDALMRFSAILIFFRIRSRSFLWSAASSFPATGSYPLLRRRRSRSACVANVRLRHAAMAPSCQRVSVCYPMSGPYIPRGCPTFAANCVSNSLITTRDPMRRRVRASCSLPRPRGGRGDHDAIRSRHWRRFVDDPVIRALLFLTL